MTTIRYQVAHERKWVGGGKPSEWKLESVLYDGTDRNIAMLTLACAYKMLAADVKDKSLDYSRVRIIETEE